MSVPRKPMVNTYQIRGAFTAPTSNVATLQFPRAGRIKQLLVSITAEAGGANQRHVVELAKNRAVSQINSNVSTPSGILASVAMGDNITTSGATQFGGNVIVPINEPVSPNDTLNLHGSTGGEGNEVIANVLVYVEE